MIKIDISKEKMKEIEELHWEWFKNKKLKNWISKIKLETELQTLFFADNKFKEWFDKKSSESVVSWYEKQKEDKFDIFRKLIIGQNLGKAEYGLSENNKSYFENQYTEFRTYNENEWNGVNLIEKLGLTVCPYCNRNYISIIKDKEANTLKATAQLDHFYPKTKYPYLALSLYNLIPVCGACNLIKHNNEETNLIYPYNEEFGDTAKFTIDLGYKELDEVKKYDVDVLLGMSDNFIIDFYVVEGATKEERGLKEKIEKSIDTFKLDKMYHTNHNDYVRELIKKAIIYNESRIDELYSQYGSLFSSREEVVNMIVSNYIDEKDIGKRPLAKLTRDICSELGIK